MTDVLPLYALAAVGSALGGMLRVALSGVLARRTRSAFPWPTFVVNLTGCMAIGLFFGATGSGPLFQAAPPAHQLLTYGVLGGYTTFSTFSLEALELARRGARGEAALYVVASFGACVAGTTLGFALTGGGA